MGENAHVSSALRVAAATAFLTALTFVFLTPPFQVPDEVSHYWRARALAIGRAGGVARDGRVGSSIPHDAKTLVATTWDTLPEGVRYDRNRLAAAGRLKAERKPYTFMRIPSVVYTPVPYLPQSLMAVITDALHVRPLIAFYLGRLSLLLFTAIVAIASLRIAGERRWLLLPVICSPMTLYLVASYSGDAITIAVALLMTALIVRAADRRDEAMSTRELFMLAGAAALLIMCKAYAPLTILAFAIPLGRLRHGRQRAMALLLVLALLLPLAVAHHFAAWARSQHRDSTVDITLQQRVVTHDPIRYVRVAIGDLEENGEGYVRAAIGRLGWLDIGLPSWIYWSYGAATVWIAFALIPQTSALLRVLALLVFVVMAAAIQLSQYLSWTAVGAAHIEGVQGRYFLPVVPLLLIALASRRSALRSAWAEWLPVLAFIAADGVAIAAVYQRYWG